MLDVFFIIAILAMLGFSLFVNSDWAKYGWTASLGALVMLMVVEIAYPALSVPRYMELVSRDMILMTVVQSQDGKEYYLFSYKGIKHQIPVVMGGVTP